MEDGDLLVTIDVNSVYTNIVQKDGLDSVEWALQKYSDMKQEQINYILEGLKMAMSKNYFWYKGNHYAQTKGAMGAKYAPSVANIIMN